MLRGRRIRHSTRDIFILLLGGQGADYLRGCILEHQIFRFAKMILRDRHSTLYDLPPLFRGRRSTLGRWSGKSQNALARGRQLCTQLSILEGSLAEWFRFWCCQLRKLRRCRRIVSLLMLSTSKIEEVSQNCLMLSSSKIEEVSWNSFVFNLAGRQRDR